MDGVGVETILEGYFPRLDEGQFGAGAHGLLFEAFLIVFQLHLKPQIGAYFRPFALAEFERLVEGHLLFFDEVGYHQRG